MRVPNAPEPACDRSRHYHEASPLRARWVAHPAAPPHADAPAIFVADYRLSFAAERAAVVRVFVSADEQYVLRLDGHEVGRGPERGTREAWCLDAYDLPLSPGRHELSAVVHSLGRGRGYAQESVRHAFLLYAEGDWTERLSTGVAAWSARQIDAYEPRPVSLKAFIATGTRFMIDGRKLLAPAEAVKPMDVGPMVLASLRMESPRQWLLVPAVLPAMVRTPVPPGKVRQVEGPVSAEAWQAFVGATPVSPATGDARPTGDAGVAPTQAATPLTVPPNTTASALIDLNDYYCADTALAVRGGAGAAVTIEWAEALFDADGRTKHQRDRVDGLHFFGFGDVMRCPGDSVTFEPLWWLPGRYVRVSVTTADAPLTIDRLAFTETRYPTTWDTQVQIDHPAVAALLPPAKRAIENCAHDTFFDCPYYEQLMYAGDTRLDALVTYTHSRDDRLPRKAVRLFDGSRGPDGWTLSRVPTKLRQTIPPFSWAWISMVHDLAMWRDCPADVAAAMPGVRAVMEASYAAVNADGLYVPVAGWHFVDWARGWLGGFPPDAASKPSAPVHFQLACAAAKAAELEEIAGEPLLAERHRQRHAQLVEAGVKAFLDAGRGLFADDPEHRHFSEHAQALAVLAGALGGRDAYRLTRAAHAVPDRLADGRDLTAATIYFSHYVFEALRQLNRIDPIFDRLQFWAGLADMGFKTTPEQPEPSRSDCHAWGAHPMFHLVATILGVRPAAAGFKKVRIEPMLGPLNQASGRIVHPAGTIDIRVRRDSDRLHADVTLPAGVQGELIANGETTPL